VLPNEASYDPEVVTGDDKLWVLLAYLLTPITPLIIWLMADKRERPFIKAHSPQAMVLGCIQVGLALLGSVTGSLSLIPAVFLGLAQIYWGIQGFNPQGAFGSGRYVTIPVIGDLVRR
jgi:uncharacterized membrane protein